MLSIKFSLFFRHLVISFLGEMLQCKNSVTLLLQPPVYAAPSFFSFSWYKREWEREAEAGIVWGETSSTCPPRIAVRQPTTPPSDFPVYPENKELFSNLCSTCASPLPSISSHCHQNQLFPSGFFSVFLIHREGVDSYLYKREKRRSCADVIRNMCLLKKKWGGENSCLPVVFLCVCV